MKHESKNTLVQIFYHEASPEEEQRAQEHLAACASCREYVEVLRRMETRLSHWPDAKPAPETFARVLARLPRTKPRVSYAKPAIAIKPIFGLAFVLFGILLVLYFTRSMVVTLPLWSAYEQHWLAQTLGGAGLLLAIFFGFGTFIRLALAPILYFDAHKSSLQT